MTKKPPRKKRRPSRAELLRRRRRRRAVKLCCAVLALSAAAFGVSYALAGRSALDRSPAVNAASYGSQAAALNLTADEAREMLSDPLMILVNHENLMPESYTFDTKYCGSQRAINGRLQTEAADAFLEMQADAAADGITLWMQSGWRSSDYQNKLYNDKVGYYLGKGLDEAAAKEKAAEVVNPAGSSEHNCGLAADINCPEYTGLDEGFKDTAAYSWLCAHAGGYGFILRYPEGREDVTDIIFEPWHWRYIGRRNAARVNASGLVLEEYIAELQRIVARE